MYGRAGAKNPTKKVQSQGPRENGNASPKNARAAGAKMGNSDGTFGHRPENNKKV